MYAHSDDYAEVVAAYGNPDWLISAENSDGSIIAPFRIALYVGAHTTVIFTQSACLAEYNQWKEVLLESIKYPLLIGNKLQLLRPCKSTSAGWSIVQYVDMRDDTIVSHDSARLYFSSLRNRRREATPTDGSTDPLKALKRLIALPEMGDTHGGSSRSFNDGQEVHVKVPCGCVPNSDDFGLLASSIRSRDQAALSALVGQGKAILLDGGTKGEVVASGLLGGRTNIFVKSGEHVGRTCDLLTSQLDID
jgi:hypothetical protein